MAEMIVALGKTLDSDRVEQARRRQQVDAAATVLDAQFLALAG